MPPRKDVCRNFQRGSCLYGERCKFLHVKQQQPKPNDSGFGGQTNSQYQRSFSQQQQPNPFGFGVQGSSQPRGAIDFGSKENQFKPFENKWTRPSPSNTGVSQAPRQPDNQPQAANHKCTDPESCNRQIIEDFKHERPLWTLTCYGHNKSGPCDISGDTSYEELRAAAYDDARRGLSLQSIVERERNLLNAKVVEFQSLIRSPYAVPQNSAIATQSAFPGATPIVSQNSTPPPVSSFSQLGSSLNVGFGMSPATPPNNAFPSNPSSSQTANAFGTRISPFGIEGSFGSQLHNQPFGGSFASNSANFSNNAVSAERNLFPTSVMSPQIPGSTGFQSSILPNGPNFASPVVGQLSPNVGTINKVPQENSAVDDSVWLKEEWNPGEIPEEAPPDKYII